MGTTKVIVTGAGGFLGKALAKRLAALGHKVTGIARGDYPELKENQIELLRYDLAQGFEFLVQPFEGAAAVFHVAAKVDMWGRYRDFFQTNVIGTRNVIKACLAAGVPNLVFTSSPSVVADGKDLENIDESYPYPGSYHAFYPETKAMAEREVLAANHAEILHTAVLRPHLIFGPGDRNFVPTILERARRGRLVQVGEGKNLADFCFIDDCVNAHILAFEALKANPQAHGRAYFISQGEPYNLWGWIGRVLELNKLPPISRRISKGMAMAAAAGLEGISSVLPLKPQFTRFLVSEMTTHHYFNIRRAKQELRYEPSCSVGEALEKTFGG
jgi:2-alkyl-3-oxoalkanoate reductase